MSKQKKNQKKDKEKKEVVSNAKILEAKKTPIHCKCGLKSEIYISKVPSSMWDKLGFISVSTCIFCCGYDLKQRKISSAHGKINKFIEKYGL